MSSQKKRFTLVEILMVTGMICLIAALIVVAYNGVYRSWSSKNTIATMKAAHLALDRYMLENNGYPLQNWSNSSNGYLRFAVNSSDPAIVKLAKDLLQDCAPYSYEDNSRVIVFDDFGPKPPNTPSAIHYVFPYGNSFALISKGKNGAWGGDDDIIYLPTGNGTLKPGFYTGKLDEGDGSIEDAEPIAQ